MNKLPINPAFKQLFADLHNHAALTSSGLDSEEASSVIFNRLRTEDAYYDMSMRSSVSSCCCAIVHYHDVNQAYCSACGNFCRVMPNDTDNISNRN